MGGGCVSRIKLYIYSEKEHFGRRLARYVSGQQHLGMTVELLTEIKETAAFQTDAWVVSDNEKLLEKAGCQTIHLVKEPEAGERELFMYQSREDIYRQLLQKTGQRRQSCVEERDGKAKIICVFSPDENPVFALHTAADEADRHSVLYVSFCGVPLLIQEEFGGKEKLGCPGLSELMLCEEPEQFEEKLAGLAYRFGTISVLAPAKHFRDLFDFTPEEVMRFMEHLKQQTLFDAVVIETGHLYEFTFSLLAGADEILSPKESGFFADAKRRVLQEYFQREGQEDLWRKIQFIPDMNPKTEDREDMRRLFCGEKVCV